MLTGPGDSQYGGTFYAMLNAATSLEGLLPVLERRHLLQALLCAQPLASGRLAPVALLQPLLCPRPRLDPLLRNRVAGLVLQVIALSAQHAPLLFPSFVCRAPSSPATRCVQASASHARTNVPVLG